MAAPARIHRRNELHTRREGDVRIRSRNADIAGLKRLPKRIQNAALEFRQFVEERTPRWARLISPGRTRRPPPTKAGIEAL